MFPSLLARLTSYNDTKGFKNVTGWEIQQQSKLYVEGRRQRKPTQPTRTHGMETRQKKYLPPGMEKAWFLPDAPNNIPLEPDQRLVAIGDIHGNIYHLAQSLLAGRIITNIPTNMLAVEQYIWSAGNTVCVQLGDILDRGQHEEVCLLILLHLARQARQQGGYLILLFGNHELMSISADKDYEICQPADAFDNSFKETVDWWMDGGYQSGCCTASTVTRRAVFSPGGPLSRPFLSKVKVAVKVGGSILVHAGIHTADFKNYEGLNGGDLIAKMNQDVRDWISDETHRPILNTRNQLWHTRRDTYALFLSYNDAIISSMPAALKDTDLLWTRKFASQSDSLKDDADLDTCLQRVEADRMIIGHNRQKRINAVLGKKVWRVDLSHEGNEFRDNGEALVVYRHDLESRAEHVTVANYNWSLKCIKGISA